MCGRFTQTASPAVIAQEYGVETPPLFAPRYNTAPSQPVAAIRIEPGTTTCQLVLLRWGLIPSWAKDPKIGHQCINAKAETVAEKPSFRAAFKTRRCLVIATGFYEWQVQGPAKQPMWIGLKSQRSFAFAGLWEQWQPPESAVIESCKILSVLTFLGPLHFSALENNCLAKPTRIVLAYFVGNSPLFSPMNAHSTNEPLSLPISSPFELN